MDVTCFQIAFYTFSSDRPRRRDASNRQYIKRTCPECHPGYRGGFSEEQVDELLAFLADNHLGWSAAMAPVIMGNSDRPELGARLENSFCSTDPEIARDFARATFLSDNRDDLASVSVRTLVLQCSNDIIAPVEVGEYVHAKIKNSDYLLLKATGHCPHLSAPDEVTAAMRNFVG